MMTHSYDHTWPIPANAELGIAQPQLVSFFWENFKYINQGSGQKKMSEDVVQNVSKSVCSAQKAYLLCISNNISGLGPFF